MRQTKKIRLDWRRDQGVWRREVRFIQLFTHILFLLHSIYVKDKLYFFKDIKWWWW